MTPCVWLSNANPGSQPGVAWLFVALGLAVMGCDRSDATAPAVPATTSPKTAPAGPSPTPADAPRLAFRAQELPFRYDRGETGAFWPVEVTGGGVGLLDYDGDGDLDLFFAQGGPLKPGTDPKSERGSESATGSDRPPARDALFRNDGGGKFTDVSAEIGLVPKGYGQGVTVADYDGDGDPDVYVTRYKGNTLWRNDGGRFTDVTGKAGVGVGLWSLGAAFFDYDGDGDLDLFVANYFDFDPSQAPYARDPVTGAGKYGMPQDFPGQPDALYRNNGDGTFTDVTAASGVAGKGRGMGCLAADFDGDGRLDVLVANDAEPNALWRNRGDGTFEEVAYSWGLALNGDGRAEANMGIAHGDTDGDGLPDVAISHFANERTTLWRRLPEQGAGTTFFDVSEAAGLVPASRPVTGWGIALADLDNDGRPDLIQANGHILNEPGRTYPYENPLVLWRNEGSGRFRSVAGDAGPYFKQLRQARGLAVGDLDQDGDLDVVVSNHNVPAVVLWNETTNRGHLLVIRLKGSGANRDAIGAVVKARAGGLTFVRTVDGGGGYLSSNDPGVAIGLGRASRAESVEVRWPSGRIETRTGVHAGEAIRWSEGSTGSDPRRDDHKGPR
jgi:hypothetical protein